MTRDEAIKYLIKPVVTSTIPNKEIEKQIEAYEMAIEALKQKSITHAHWEERKDHVIDGFEWAICSHCNNLLPAIPYCGFCGAKMDEEVE